MVTCLGRCRHSLARYYSPSNSAFYTGPIGCSKSRHATFVVNDGKSLAAVADGSINFAFSFDSLVHVEIDPSVSRDFFGAPRKSGRSRTRLLYDCNLPHGNIGGLPL